MSWLKSRPGYLGSVLAILIISYENLSKFLNFSAFMSPTDNGDYSGTQEGASCYWGRSWIWLKNWYNWTNSSRRNLSLYTMHLHQHLLWQPNKRIRKCTSNIIPGQSSLALRVLHGRKSRESEKWATPTNPLYPTCGLLNCLSSTFYLWSSPFVLYD